MSKISERIRSYVNDPSVADEYGEWGALRPDQRKQIRELCDLCDKFEQTADALLQSRRTDVAEIFKDILILLREYEHSALIAKNNYGITQVHNFGTDILKLKYKYLRKRK